MGSEMCIRDRIRTTLDLLADGRLRPVLARSFPLVAAGEAQALLESREFFGNIVLEIDA